MDFSGSGGMSKSGDIDSQLKMLEQQVQAQLVVKQLQKINDKCFDKCISKPGTSLDNSQQKCLAYCMDRWMDTEKLVAQTLVARVQEESHLS